MNGNPLRLQGGIFGLGGLFSDKKKTKTKQTIDQTENTTKAAQSQTQQNQQEQSKSTTTTLAQGIQDQLAGLLTTLVSQQAGDNAAAGRIGDVADLLLQRAGAAEEVINSRNAAILADARRAGQDELAQLKTQLATDAGGSTFNTFVAGAVSQGAADLESQLASAEGQLANEARNTATTELLNAINAIATGAQTGVQGITGIAGLGELLRGATTVTENVGTVAAQGLETTNETINTILKQLLESKTTTADKPSILKTLQNLAKLPAGAGG